MTKFLWLDMEMTGLDVQKEVVIEVAAVVTDLAFNELETYHSVIKQPQSYIDQMDAWNKNHHGQSGLVAQIPSGRAPDTVETDLIELVDKHFGTDKPVLAGNSISQDRLFIDKYFGRLASRLHYRMLDVTSWKVVFNGLYQLSYKKKGAHRALDDIRESIGELKFYLSFVKP